MIKNEVSIVIPTLNEAGGIGPLVKKCHAMAGEVIVVDGASSDGTAEEAAKNGARVIVEPRRGYGLAYLIGFQAAKGKILATTDGDGTYPVEFIPEMAELLLKENLAFISCCRFPLASPKSMALTNQIGNRVLSFVGSVLWLNSFHDILSGMWVFKKEALDEMELYSKNWNLSQEIKIEAHCRFGNRFRECHIPYYERVGVPKLSPWKVGIENLIYFAIQRLGLRKKISGKE